MKFPLTAAVLMLVSCTNEPPTPAVVPIENAEASAAAALLICEAAELAGASCIASGATATLGEHTIEVPINVTGFVVVEGRTLGMGSSKQKIPGEVQLSADVALSLDGTTLLTMSLSESASEVNLGVARDAALDQLLQRLMVGYGLAALDATIGSGAPTLAGVGMTVEPASLEGATVWAAYPMLSGVGLDPSTGSRMGPTVSSMASALTPYLAGLEAGLHSVEVAALLGGAGGPGPCGLLPPVVAVPGSAVSMVRLEGTVLVDGQATGDICTMSETVAWPLPRSNASLRWQQYFVVKVAPPAGE
ncbi:MAG: hypothetical protein ACI8RZ_000314 [Myxococcota bacterium]|jgi:hypothetical protein